MKKLYAFIIAAFVALSMSAQVDSLYVVGAGEGLEWNPGAPFKVAKVENAYTFEVKNLTQFKISTAKGTWDE